MKNRLLFTAITALFLMGTSYSQNKNFGIGIEVGPNMSTIYGHDFFQQYYQLGMGYSVGPSFQYNFPRLFSIRAKLAYESKVSKNDVVFYDQNGTTYFEGRFLNEMNYLVMPVVARISLGDKFKFHGDLGGFIGVLLKNNQKYRGEGIQIPDADNTENLSKIDAGLTIGVGGGYQITENLLLTVSIRNNLGLVKISNPNTLMDIPFSTNSTNFLVGIDYCFGSK